MALNEKRHQEVIDEFLDFLNARSAGYVIKGGTALRRCYDMGRMSEDIDMDSTDHDTIKRVVDEFCKKMGYEYRVAKDTPTVQRFFVRYDLREGTENHPLKIEISYRNKALNVQDIRKRDGVVCYDINKMAILKALAYSGRDRLRDMHDIVFIVKNYGDDLEPSIRGMVGSALAEKGIEQFDYLTKDQSDEHIDKDQLAEDFLYCWEELGLTDERDTENNKECITQPQQNLRE